MTFPNQKKTFLAKVDKSKKCEIDEKIVSLISVINDKENYYTTSSCSGRVYFWQGSGKKNETDWLKVSHDSIGPSFFAIEASQGLVWLRYEGFIMHIACKDLLAAEKLLDVAQSLYKKSSLLTIKNKIIIEIRDSQFIEMPFYHDETRVFSGDWSWLANTINFKLQENWQKIEKLQRKIKAMKEK